MDEKMREFVPRGEVRTRSALTACVDHGEILEEAGVRLLSLERDAFRTSLYELEVETLSQ